MLITTKTFNCIPFYYLGLETDVHFSLILASGVIFVEKLSITNSLEKNGAEKSGITRKTIVENKVKIFDKLFTYEHLLLYCLLQPYRI